MDAAAALDCLRPAMAAETVEPHTPLNDVEGLSEADLAEWDENGHVVLEIAVSVEAAEAAYEFPGMNRENAENWYAESLGHFMVISGSGWIILFRPSGMRGLLLRRLPCQRLGSAAMRRRLAHTECLDSSASTVETRCGTSTGFASM